MPIKRKMPTKKVKITAKGVSNVRAKAKKANSVFTALYKTKKKQICLLKNQVQNQPLFLILKKK